jgi:cytoskeletal protein RodZ
MNSSRTILILAAGALGAGLAWSPLAQAQSSNPDSSTPPSAASSAPMAQAPSASPSSSSSASSAQSVKPRSDAQVEGRITQLHKELKITSAQESDWSKLAQDMRDNAHDMSSLLQERNAAAKSHPMTALDNLKNYEQITDAHADGLKKLVPDFETLYGEMSPAQKKAADTVFNQRVNQRVRTTATPSSGGHG